MELEILIPLFCATTSIRYLNSEIHWKALVARL